jgi:hypothetical protein
MLLDPSDKRCLSKLCLWYAGTAYLIQISHCRNQVFNRKRGLHIWLAVPKDASLSALTTPVPQQSCMGFDTHGPCLFLNAGATWVCAPCLMS